MKTHIVTFLMLLFASTSFGEPDPNWSNLPLSLIAAAQDTYYSYQLYQSPISGPRWDLFLLIKNTGVMNMKMKGDKKPLISIKDSKGKKLYIFETSDGIGIANQSVGVIHVSAQPPENLRATFTLEVKGLELLKITIPGIKPLQTK